MVIVSFTTYSDTISNSALRKVQYLYFFLQIFATVELDEFRFPRGVKYYRVLTFSHVSGARK